MFSCRTIKVFFFFFFSSRRRHTRSLCDWSSDVCSSDLPNVRIRSQAVATNIPPHGAFRGFGAPQSIFALERHLDKVAQTVGLTAEGFRRRNFIHEGETTATSQVIHESVNLDHLLTRAFELTDYHAKRE